MYMCEAMNSWNTQEDLIILVVLSLSYETSNAMAWFHRGGWFYQLNSTRSDSTNQPSNSTTELRFAPIKYPSNVHLVYIWVADFGHLELCDRCESQHCFEN